jgi:hypothetical protein
MFLLQSLAHCRPAAYEDWLRECFVAAFEGLRRRHGLPEPEQIDDFPVQASFVDGQLRDGMGSGWPGRGLDQTSARDP